MHLTRKLAVTGKKGRIVINILRHAKPHPVCNATYHLSRAEWRCLLNFEALKDSHIDDNRNVCAYYGASVANSSALR
jgi:hypothetical protein